VQQQSTRLRLNGRLLEAFTPRECANYFAAAGYDETSSDSALAASEWRWPQDFCPPVEGAERSPESQAVIVEANAFPTASRR